MTKRLVLDSGGHVVSFVWSEYLSTGLEQRYIHSCIFVGMHVGTVL